MPVPRIVDVDDRAGGAVLEVRRIATVLHVAGEIDVTTAPSFGRALDLCDRDPCLQALDLTGVTFFSAAGVRCFVRSGWPTQPHGLVIASPCVRRVLELCGLEILLTAHGWTSALDGWVDADDRSRDH